MMMGNGKSHQHEQPQANCMWWELDCAGTASQPVLLAKIKQLAGHPTLQRVMFGSEVATEFSFDFTDRPLAPQRLGHEP